MKDYEISWSIGGTVVVRAETAEEAESNVIADLRVIEVWPNGCKMSMVDDADIFAAEALIGTTDQD